jgi:hypothetical protein
MSNESDATKSDALQQARAKAQRTANAFESVFGQPRKRSAAQSHVIEHLAICAGDEGNAYRFNEARDGVALIAAGIHRDGAKSLLRVIERQLAIAARVREPKKEKPVTTR